MSAPERLSLTAVAMALVGLPLLWVPVLWLHLTPALFAALITYGGTRAIATLLTRQWPRLRHPQAWSLFVLVGGVSLAGSIAIERAAETAAAGGGYAGLMQQMATTLEQLRTMLPAWLTQHLPMSLEALRQTAANWLRSHAAQVQLWGGHTVRGLGYALAGLVIGALLALQLRPQTQPSDAPPPLVPTSLRRSFDSLVAGFTAVVFAQLRIAALNTALTALYLLVVLPLLGRPLPLTGTLLAVTFIASLIPVLGNLVSNAIIVIISLTHSVAIAGLSLAWLFVIHKLEYFLNAHIVGRRIHAQAWELLLAMLVLEALFGLAGLVSAPVIYAQAKAALLKQGWL